MPSVTSITAATIVTNDAECRRILLEAGMLAGMVPDRGSYANQVISTFKHGGHYCMAIRDLDHEDPIDNGYTIILLPENVISAGQAMAFFQGCILDLTGGGQKMLYAREAPGDSLN